MGNFVRGLALSVSGFVGMSLCMNYASSASSPYLVPAGLGSVSLGVVGFMVMVSGMNRETTNPGPVHEQAQAVSNPDLQLRERPQAGEGKELGRIDHR